MTLSEKKQIGLIAQEVETVLPDLTISSMDPGRLDKEGNTIVEPMEVMSVNYVGLIPYLIKATQEQQNLINDQKTLINDLSSRLDQFTSQIMTSDIDHNQLVDGAELFQNRPNPFSDETKIRYSLPKIYSHGQILIFDMQGKQIKSYNTINAGGEISINANELETGMYMYSLIVDGKEIDTKRMILTD